MNTAQADGIESRQAGHEQPLSGLRVLDFGHYLAGPLAGLFLADQGAEVIQVRRPGAAVWDANTASTLARGKRLAQALIPAQTSVASINRMNMVRW